MTSKPRWMLAILSFLLAFESSRADSFVPAGRERRRSPNPYRYTHVKQVIRTHQPERGGGDRVIEVRQQDSDLQAVIFDARTRTVLLLASVAVIFTPLLGYSIITNVLDDLDQLQVGTWVGGGLASALSIGWAATLRRHKAKKDAKNTRRRIDYEDAAVQSRMTRNEVYGVR